jgi:hypothetical protein
LVNGIRTLTDFKADRRISAGFNTGPLTGSATIYLVAQGVWQVFRINGTPMRSAVAYGWQWNRWTRKSQKDFPQKSPQKKGGRWVKIGVKVLT